MKKIFYLLVLAIGVAGCSVESLDSSDELLTVDAKTKAVITETGEITYPTKPVCLGEDLQISFNVEPGSKIQLQEKIDGEWIQVFKNENTVNNPETYSYNYPLPTDYYFRYKIGSGGFTELPPILVKPCPTCTDQLTTSLTCSTTKTVDISFKAEEAGPIVIQGGLTSGAQINSATSNLLTRNTTHSSVINSKASVTRWEGDVEACKEVIITIEYSGGNGIGDWTAKRGEVELAFAPAKECE